MSATRATTAFQLGVHLSWGFGLILGAFCLANFSPAAAMACVGVVVMLGTWITYTFTGWVDRSPDADAGSPTRTGAQSG